MRRRLLKIANAALAPFGAQLYKSGMDMESALQKLAQRAPGIGTVVDIGASDGRWSRMAMNYFTAARFLAVEPLAERERGLKALRSSFPRFDYELCVAGEHEDGSVPLAVGDDLDGSTVGGTGGVSRMVPSQTIDRIVQQHACPGPFLLKFDTHGFEVPILKGAAQTLANTDYIVMEVYNYRHTAGTLLFPEMCSLLDGLGFRSFKLVDPMQRPLDDSLWQMDLFFARHDNAVFARSSYQAS